jgi:hypothetical protein
MYYAKNHVNVTFHVQKWNHNFVAQHTFPLDPAGTDGNSAFFDFPAAQLDLDGVEGSQSDE